MPIFALRTTSNREDQVFDFVKANVEKKGLGVYGVIRAHGLRGYIFLEAESRESAEEAYQRVPYARGLLPSAVDYKEIEHMLEQVKVQVNILPGDIVEVISGPFKREQAKVTRIDHAKDDVVVELLEAAVPIPITVKMDSVKVIRRDEAAAEKLMNRESVPEEKVEVKESVEEVMKGEEAKEEAKKEEEKKKKKKKDKRVDDEIIMNLDDDEFELNL
jgi:transcriptional antiterminator NusG